MVPPTRLKRVKSGVCSGGCTGGSIPQPKINLCIQSEPPTRPRTLQKVCGPGAYFSNPIFALKPWVQAGRFEYLEPYNRKIFFLSYKGVPCNLKKIEKDSCQISPKENLKYYTFSEHQMLPFFSLSVISNHETCILSQVTTLVRRRQPSLKTLNTLLEVQPFPGLEPESKSSLFFD